MKISTKGRYALRVLIDLSERNPNEFIPLTDIADKQGISEKYLESIVSVLTLYPCVAKVEDINFQDSQMNIL